MGWSKGRQPNPAESPHWQFAAWPTLSGPGDWHVWHQWGQFFGEDPNPVVLRPNPVVLGRRWTDARVSGSRRWRARRRGGERFVGGVLFVRALGASTAAGPRRGARGRFVEPRDERVVARREIDLETRG